MGTYRRLAIGTVVLTGFFTVPACMARPVRAKTAKADWLPLCGKCEKPTIFAESSIGTAYAVAKARVTYQDAVGYCEQWSTLYSTTATDCDKQAKETLKEENGKVYTATADCVHGKLTIADGENFVYAGLCPLSPCKVGPNSWQGEPAGVGVRDLTKTRARLSALTAQPGPPWWTPSARFCVRVG